MQDCISHHSAGMRGCRNRGDRQRVGRREAGPARVRRAECYAELPEAYKGSVQGPRYEMQQMRLPLRRLPVVFALFLALLAGPAVAQSIQLKKHPGGGYTIA